MAEWLFEDNRIYLHGIYNGMAYMIWFMIPAHIKHAHAMTMWAMCCSTGNPLHLIMGMAGASLKVRPSGLWMDNVFCPQIDIKLNCVQYSKQQEWLLLAWQLMCHIYGDIRILQLLHCTIFRMTSKSFLLHIIALNCRWQLASLPLFLSSHRTLPF